MTEWIEKLRQWVAESDNMVFFGGAGVSTESGIPDFRSVDGLYHQKFQYPPETILSHSFYVRHKAEFYDFYRAKMLAPWAQPNAAHRKLAQWEQEGKLKAVITQNIDGLHQKAGSKRVIELHGNLRRVFCTRCGREQNAQAFCERLRPHYAAGDDEAVRTALKCPACGGRMDTDVVLYGDAVRGLEEADALLRRCDLLAVIGTSLETYPAAALPDLARRYGARVMLENRDCLAALSDA